MSDEGLFSGLWDHRCPVIEWGGQGAPCLRESPVDRFAALPFAAGFGVGALGGREFALTALLVVVRYVEHTIDITIPGQPKPVCPITESTANELMDLGFAVLGWKLGQLASR